MGEASSCKKNRSVLQQHIPCQCLLHGRLTVHECFVCLEGSPSFVNYLYALVFRYRSPEAGRRGLEAW